MAFVLADRVQQTGTANTTVSFTLSGSVTGFQSFSVIGNTNTTYYAATDTSGNWEVGIGTYSTTGPTLTRTTILSSSNSGSAVNAFSGTVTVFVTYPSVRSVSQDGYGTAGQALTSSGSAAASTWATVGYIGTPINTQASTYTLVLGDQGKTIYAAGNLTIPANSSVAFPVGTIVNVIASAGITVAITTDTLQWGGQASSQTGTRTLAAYAMATLVKVTSTTWYISGAGVT
jgi:hypothetical protein